MVDLKTSYLGLKLKNPIIVGSSGLTSSVDKIKKLEDNNAGAIVLKSLFEEQINFEATHIIGNSDYPEAEDYISNYLKNNTVEDYLKLIEQSKNAVNIPVIASINCITAKEWISFAKNIQSAGADALELNLFFLPASTDDSSEKYEQLYLTILEKIKNIINIPVSVKLGIQFTNLLSIINKLYYRGTKGIVLFNRFYTPDIDVDTMKIISSDVLSSPSDIHQTLRWIAIVSDKVEKIDLAASTGVHDEKAVVKLLLAGANVVQICSVLYKNGPEYLSKIVNNLEKWMQSQNIKSVDEIRGKLNYKNISEPSIYERSQFMKYFSGLE